MRIREIFIEAVEIADAAERAAYLAAACGGDAALRREVEELLASHARDEQFFLDRPPAALPHSFASAARDSTEPASQPLGSQIGPYRLVQVLGEGGMGIVYLAEQKQPVERQVALKIIKAGMDSRQTIARFESERQALAMMDHPNIARVLDAGISSRQTPSADAGPDGTRSVPATEGCPYFVMEYVSGLPITRYCDEKRLPLSERLELLIPVCHAVQHAHQKGIIHRDIKPSNVLVTEYDGRATPKVIDFGVAKAVASPPVGENGHTAVGQIIGTLEYMSPEQAEFNPLDIDTRTDIYSLGVLLYELLAGATPFDKADLRNAGLHEMLRIIREEEPPSPSSKVSASSELPSIAAVREIDPARLTKAIRGELDWIVMKALDKDRNRRYGSAADLAADLNRYLAHEAVLACPPSTLYRFRKLAQKHQPALCTAALVVLALVAGTAASTWQAIRARQAERLAKENEARALRHEQRAVAAASAELAARQAEAQHRQQAEEQARTVEAQRALLENNQRINSLVTNEILTVLRDIPTGKSKRHQLLAAALSRVGDLEPAERVKALYTVGSHLTVLGDHPAALNAINQALALDPQQALLYVSRGDKYFRQQEYLKAADDYTLAIEHRRDDDPASVHLPYARRGFALCRLGRFDEAIADFRASFAESPKPTLAILAQCFNGRKTGITNSPFYGSVQSDVIGLFERYVADQGRSPLAASFAADALVDLKQPGLARAHLEAADVTGLRGWYVHYQRAMLAIERGDQSDYRRICQAALANVAGEQEEREPKSWIFSAYVCMFIPDGLDDYSPAIDLARRALAKAPGSAQCRAVLGGILYRAGQFDEARQRFEAGLETHVDEVGNRLWSHFFLAMISHRRGQLEEAKRWNQQGTAILRTAPYNNWRFQIIMNKFRAEAEQFLSLPPPEPNSPLVDAK